MIQSAQQHNTNNTTNKPSSSSSNCLSRLLGVGMSESERETMQQSEAAGANHALILCTNPPANLRLSGQDSDRISSFQAEF